MQTFLNIAPDKELSIRLEVLQVLEQNPMDLYEMWDTHRNYFEEISFYRFSVIVRDLHRADKIKIHLNDGEFVAQFNLTYTLA